ncbi:MAG: DUF362 domain-containing protein [Deltaproteobacteria bacterium]|nr:DUF362 domain-containing protein [Deltaproteobacteria bacterium]
MMEGTNRRDFLLRLLKGGLTITAACTLSYWLYDGIGPHPGEKQVAKVTLPDFSMPSLRGKMSIVSGLDRVKTINRGLEALGGIETFVKQGDRVLLKVNAAFATPPLLSATTNPQLVGEIARLCYKAGASEVIVTDNPINDPASCFSLTGIEEAAQLAGAKVLLPRQSYFQPTTVTNGVLIRNWPILWEPFQKINRVIGIAPVKDHHRSGASMTMKNWYGLLGGSRNVFHQDIHNIIKELAIMVKPTLVVLDGTTTMITNGPTGGSLGDLKKTGTMIVSTDQVAADAFGATLLGRKPTELPYLAKAEAAGVGTADYESLKPIRIDST